MASNIRSLGFETPASQNWIIVAEKDGSRDHLFFRVDPDSLAAIEFSVGHTGATEDGAFPLEVGAGYGFENEAPAGPVFARSLTGAVGTLIVLDG